MNHFGQWLACADGKAHYHLGGRALCGCPALPTATPTRKPYGRLAQGGVIVPHCARCVVANENRWACKSGPSVVPAVRREKLA